MVSLSARKSLQNFDPLSVNPAGLIALAHAGESLPLKAMRVRAQQSGLYLSPFKGRGMEFDESRPYQPGDDVRSLDWKVTARSGRTHTKQFREERERPVLVWLDLRRTMYFATRGCLKSVAACRAAALLGWSTSAHRDRFGGLIFSEYSHQEQKPSRGKSAVLQFIQTTCKHPAWHKDRLAEAELTTQPLSKSMLRLMNVAHPGSLIFLISDFRGFDEKTGQHLGQIARHNDVVMIHISDPMESELPPPGNYRVSNGSRAVTLDSRNKNFRQQYVNRFQKHRAMLQNYCKRHRLYYVALSTTDNVVDCLQSSLGLK